MARRRVLGFVLVYNPRRGEYRQRLQLGAVYLNMVKRDNSSELAERVIKKFQFR